MDQNHDENIQGLVADLSAATAEPTTTRRRVSRRVTAHAGEAEATPVVAEGASQTSGGDIPADTAAPSLQQSEAADGANEPAVSPKRRTTRTRKTQATDAPESESNATQESEVGSSPDSANQNVTPEEGSSTRRRGGRSKALVAVSGTKADAAPQEGGTQDDAASAEGNAESTEPSDKQETNGRENQRSSRTRQRERKRRGVGDDGESEIAEDDVLLPIAGILDVLDNYAFVRTSGYLPGTGDVYVSLGQVKKYGMRKGDAIVGAIRQPREGEGNGRQKYNAIVKVDAINQRPVDEQQTRPEFAQLTPIHPTERLRLETDRSQLGTRLIDLFAPVGKGQRGLITGAHETGKSELLQQVAKSVAANQSDAHLMLVLIDERPEVVTELQRNINGEVIASTFDRPAEDHTTIAELAVERAKRLVELGHDVVVLIDSLTDLARAYNLAAPASVRVPAGSLDAASVFAVKRLLSAARKIENGGSLTILATVSAQPGSAFDAALLAELEAVANMQLRLSGEAADRRIYPAVDVMRSSTRGEVALTSEAEAKVMAQLRRGLQSQSALDSLESVLDQLGRTSSNVEFLAVTQRQIAGV